MNCAYPRTSEHKGKLIQLPCGQCVRCLIWKKLEWSGRLLAEGTQYESTSFLTLTYEDNPIDLRYRDIQLYLKRERRARAKHDNHNPLRFYSVGEYGERNGRPHWHLLLFGKHPPVLGLTELKNWPHGLAYYGNLTPASAAYTAGYNLKGIGDPRKAFARMSRMPGLGYEYFKKAGEICAKQNRPPIVTHIRYADRTFPVGTYCRKVFNEAYFRAGGTEPPKYDPDGHLRQFDYYKKMKDGNLDKEIKRVRSDIKNFLRKNGS